MKIVLATFGSLGDLHPKIAIGLELKKRGHHVKFAAMEFYREKLEILSFEFCPMRPFFDLDDRELARDLMQKKTGPEKMIKGVIFPALSAMYEDLTKAVEGTDLFITGEIIYAAKSVAEKNGVKWVSTSLAPISMFSSYDPNIYPMAEWMESLRFMPAAFHQMIFKFMRWTIRDWFEPYREFRRELGLDESHDPVFSGKYSDLLHLAMFSKVLSPPQPDWFPSTVQTGFCFYDGQNDTGPMPESLAEFLEAGEPPIVFTLGSAAAMDPRDFFEESAKAAGILNRRAVLLYGIINEPPNGLNENIIGFDYAPYSLVFPKAACVVHQGGVGTTSQALRAGIPALIMPYSHDQPDNAARCRRMGTAEIISRDDYTAENAVKKLVKVLGDLSFRANAKKISEIVKAEHGAKTACDAIERVLME